MKNGSLHLGVCDFFYNFAYGNEESDISYHYRIKTIDIKTL